MCNSRSPRAARPVSCVTISKLFFRSRARFSRRSTIASPVAESRLPVGSSAKIMSGSFTNARAIATRCCSPPESSAGKCCIRSARPTAARLSSAAFCCGRPANHSRQRDIFQGRQFRQQEISLKNKTHLLVAKPRLRRLTCRCKDCGLRIPPCPIPGRSKPGKRVKQRRLSGAGRAANENDFALRDIERNPAQDFDPARTHLERLKQITGDQLRWLRHGQLLRQDRHRASNFVVREKSPG